jgi:PKD repeat protein
LVLPAGAPNTPPVAVASATPTSGAAPLGVNFSSAGSNDPDGSIASYSWNFGDGTTVSSLASPGHVYQNAGSYTAVLTVTDNRGAIGTAQVPITANSNPLVAPTNLTGTAGRGSVTLKWTDNSTYQTGFYIERAPSGSSSFVQVGSVTGNVKTFTNAVSRGTYLYRVQAFNGSSVSAYSNTVSVRVTK